MKHSTFSIGLTFDQTVSALPGQLEDPSELEHPEHLQHALQVVLLLIHQLRGREQKTKEETR